MQPVDQLNSGQSLQWLKQKIEQLRVTTIKATPKIEPGGLYFFFYQPIGKIKLPYYDTFPLVLVTGIHRDGFTGLNFHYLPPTYRIAYLKKQSVALARPMIKKYLVKQIRSRVLPVQPEEWAMSVALPLAQFRKKFQHVVWQESLDTAKNWKPGSGTVHVAGTRREE